MAVRIGDAGENDEAKAAHDALQRATGAAASAPVRAVEALSEATNLIGTVSVNAVELLDLLDQLEDDEGRQIWMVAGEVELDQWVEQVSRARDTLRRTLR